MTFKLCEACGAKRCGSAARAAALVVAAGTCGLAAIVIVVALIEAAAIAEAVGMRLSTPKNAEGGDDRLNRLGG